MSILSKTKHDINARHLSGRPAKFYTIRDMHSIKNRADWLIDSMIKNDSLLQKIRVKFGMVGA
jgi:hypothetical protein